MRLICLNTWGGRAGEALLRGFFERTRENTDVYCLQEVWADFYHDLEGVEAGGRKIKNDDVMGKGLAAITAFLPEHIPHFHPCYRDHWGNVIYTKNDFAVRDTGDVFIFRERGFEPEGDVGRCARNMQYTTLATEHGEVVVMNLHGLWNGQGKGDTEERLEQSRRIVEFMRACTQPFVLVGDFNLRPDTESLRMIEATGVRNLITEYGVTSTRTNFYDKSEKYADYVFVSPGIRVADFRVLSDEVSDHAPLLLDFEIDPITPR